MKLSIVLISLALRPTLGATLLSFDERSAEHALNQSQASYCVDSEESWGCPTCNSDVVVTTVVEEGGGRALVGYDNSTKSLFVAFRGSSDIQNWIDNIEFLKTNPYSDMPDVYVEKGFYKEYGALKEGIDTALLDAAQVYNNHKVSVTGHSAGGALATLLAFDLARGDEASAGLSLQQVITFGSPRVGDENFYNAHTLLINASVTPQWRVTHYYDMVPHVPQEALGYHHVSTEVWYDEPSTSYKVCDGSGEDDTCSNSCAPTHCTSTDDHLDYLNIPLGNSAC